jgi:DNA repair protein RecN (Recombination protein N)
MLVELAVSDLGVIDSLTLLFGPGMTALTGETGAGKTLIIEAIDLLVGGRADPVLVRAGASEARVEGRFVLGTSPDAEEIVLARVVPRDGRSRAYVNGRLATAASLAEHGRSLVDLHGQHAHQSLLGAATQRAALDRFGQIDLGPRIEAQRRLTSIDASIGALGGDARTRAREIDLLRFQIAEIEGASLRSSFEDDELAAEFDALSNAERNREAASSAVDTLTADDGALDSLGVAVAALHDSAALVPYATRLRDAIADVADIAHELRSAGERITGDPERLAAIRERRQLLRDLCRKYGETLSEVVAFLDECVARLAELEGHDEHLIHLESERREAAAELARCEQALLAARRKHAPRLAKAVTTHLPSLAMARAQLAVEVGGIAGDEVQYLLSANPGEPLQPLDRVASGGELARVMLALRLVLSEAPDTLVFDEVDAGIGGEAARAVGASLARIATDHQVFVVTHLPQVAAHADQQIAVRKREQKGRTVSSVTVLGQSDGDDLASRVVELARMLSGDGTSPTAREHAREMLSAARAGRAARV